MKANNEGAFVFAVDKWVQYDRWLILGNPGGSFYQSERDLTKQNYSCIMECAAEDFDRTLNRLVEVSEGGLAPKPGPAIFTLAALCSVPDVEQKNKAFAQLTTVCRIFPHLFMFIEYSKSFRGRGRAFRRSLRTWLEYKDTRTLAYQGTKYGNREGWKPVDVLRLAKPKSDDPVRDGVYGYFANKKKDMPASEAASLIDAVEAVKKSPDAKTTAKLITQHKLVREVIPTEHLNDKAVWAALLEDMPMTALIRNLGKMTAVGLLEPNTDACAKVLAKLNDREQLHKARIHPLQILLALSTYSAGHGVKGKLSWIPVPSVVAALDDAYYASYKNVEPTNKRLLYALDVSLSMTWDTIAGSHLTPRDASAALAMLSVDTEPMDVQVICFSGNSDKIQTLPFHKKTSLTDAVKQVSDLHAGWTHCELPALWALKNKRHYDGIIIITDSETAYSEMHPTQALQKYRNWAGHPVKQAVIGMVANEFTIADPQDPHSMDFVGFDASAPAVLRDFLVS
jgi:60 kDa SS-A/Ro ribonucleoprotein